MLKAIRFDPEEHKELLDYISTFTDKRGRHNESEAMRSLMLKGLESLNTTVVKQVETIDVEKIKAELFSQLMSAVNEQNFIPVSAPASVRVSHVKPEELHHANTIGLDADEKEEVFKKPETPKTNVTANPLLANMLGNIRK